MDNIEKESDERNRMDMIYGNEYDERYQISKNYEEIVTVDIVVFKLRKLSSKKNDDNIEKESDERNQMDMSDDRESDEVYHINKHYEEMVTNDIEV